MKGIVRIALVVAMVAVAATAILRQKRVNDRLRREIAFVLRMGAERNRLRDENRRLNEILEQRNREAAARVTEAELERARQDVAAWERRAEQIERTKAGSDVAANRDPEKGMVLLDHFRNVGRATPVAAVQTAIWAASKADFGEVGKTMALSEVGRAKAWALLARQPAETRARFDSPEKLAGVLFAYDFTNQEGFQIVDSTDDGGGRVVVHLRRLKNGIVQGSERRIPLQRGPDGWQMLVPDRAIDDIPKYLASASLRIEPAAKR